MVIHYTNIHNNVVFPGKKACIFRFKGRKSCANGDSVTLEFMFRSFIMSNFNYCSLVWHACGAKTLGNSRNCKRELYTLYI